MNSYIDLVNPRRLVKGIHYNLLARIIRGARGFNGIRVKVTPSGLQIYGSLISGSGVDWSLFPFGYTIIQENRTVTINSGRVLHGWKTVTINSRTYPVSGGTKANPLWVVLHYEPGNHTGHLLSSLVTDYPESTPTVLEMALWGFYSYEGTVKLARIEWLGNVLLGSRWS
jgi:hypothetical protein